ALPAAAWIVGVAADVACARWPTRAWVPLAALVATLLLVNGAWLVNDIERAPFLAPGLHADRTVDRASIADHALHDLREAALPPGTALTLWSPQSQAMQVSR